MILCFTFHIKLLPPSTFNENAANMLMYLFLLKLPCAPSCIILNPIAETIPPSNKHSITDQKTEGVKNTRCIYKKVNAEMSNTAFRNRLKLPYCDLPVFSK